MRGSLVCGIRNTVIGGWGVNYKSKAVESKRPGSVFSMMGGEWQQTNDAANRSSAPQSSPP
ncbi:MAG: hypothetical protein DM484_18370 [Candidatus Methylumidiphilus alinenensis]|uniref:Uncharacterized protein n=1 Tax=Candidatus Methylumidiphilus alinenensis TaxID=2202197 RepID=A0A2W4QU48_9GAMM|nr:MAG: hypothetical protein DM484_18370 [Candidatus Methylumidiphilus alinenensis]